MLKLSLDPEGIRGLNHLNRVLFFGNHIGPWSTLKTFILRSLGSRINVSTFIEVNSDHARRMHPRYVSPGRSHRSASHTPTHSPGVPVRETCHFCCLEPIKTKVFRSPTPRHRDSRYHHRAYDRTTRQDSLIAHTPTPRSGHERIRSGIYDDYI